MSPLNFSFIIIYELVHKRVAEPDYFWLLPPFPAKLPHRIDSKSSGGKVHPVGKLIVKAALSVFICCLIYEFFDIGTGVPFYSGIAAIICLQPEIKSTFRVGLNRTVGTLIGGFTGMAVLFIIREFSIFRFATLQYLLISLCILPLMYIAEAVKKKPFSVLLKKGELKKHLSSAPLVFLADFMRKSALTNITCVAFLSVTITHGTDSSISGFAVNRILDTLIGVFVSFFINIIPLGHHDKSLSRTDDADAE